MNKPGLKNVLPLKNISRRDFMGGIALGLTSGAMFSPFEALALTGKNTGKGNGFKGNGLKASTSLYPPAMTGMRGNHAGSFEISHALAWEGKSWPDAEKYTDEPYDLLVVGAGLSGLASAHEYLKKRPDARILIVDNHDDFGGHAKRNEFTVRGQELIGYGGSQSIDGPALYSPQSRQILEDLGVRAERFYRYFDRKFYRKQKMKAGIYFEKGHFKHSGLQDNFLSADDEKAAKLIHQYPLPEESRKALFRLWNGEEDYLSKTPEAEKIKLLRGISYEDFLRNYAKMPDDVILLLLNQGIGLWGLGFDALSALEAYRMEMPGFEGLALDDNLVPNPYESEEPYIFHFPDGNAGLARLLVRKLIPHAADGHGMEDIIRAKFDYERLDDVDHAVRLRLKTTVIKAVNRDGQDQVDVSMIRGGKVEKIQARHVIMACNNNILPHICPEMPKEQKQALKFPEKVPMVYINVALDNWKAFHKAGYHQFHNPHGFFHNMSLDFPVSMGGYEFTKRPDEPTVLHVVHTPVKQGQGLSAREQHRLGRHDIYHMTFADYEKEIISQLEEMLGPFGFDAEKDIAAITVNRWPHGYAYEYNELWEPWGWLDGTEDGPHILGRRRLGNISIANSDSQALAYVNGAFDAAVRAVSEQLTETL